MLLRSSTIPIRRCFGRRTITNFAPLREYAKGPVPRILLELQKQRLDNYEKKSLKDENPLNAGLTDVFNLFKPNAESREDDELADGEYELRIDKFIRSPRLPYLLHKKFQLNEHISSLNEFALIDKFSSLTPFEYDAIHKFVVDSDMSLKDWNRLPTYVKQLQYFMAFGPFGPRSYTSFNKSPFNQVQPNKDRLSMLLLGAFGIILSFGFLKNEVHQRTNSD